VAGAGPEGLLDTYGAERRPVAADVLALTHALVRLGTMTHPVQRAVRNTIVPVAGHLAPLQRRAVRRIGQINVSYTSSPPTHPDKNRTGFRPGRRVPDLEVTADGRTTRLYEILRRGRHVLLITGSQPGGDLPPQIRVWLDQLEVVTAPDGPGPAGSIYLLRPDGYVAARGPVANPGHLVDYLHQLLGPPENASSQRPRSPASSPRASRWSWNQAVDVPGKEPFRGSPDRPWR
jgi:hypothetical protein